MDSTDNHQYRLQRGSSRWVSGDSLQEERLDKRYTQLVKTMIASTLIIC